MIISKIEAVHRQARLRVIAAVQLRDYGLTSLTNLNPPLPDELIEDVRKATQQQVDELVAARSDIASDLAISVETLAGRPGDVLCDGVNSPDLLVVGHRGRGSIASELLGFGGPALRPIRPAPR